MIVDILDFAGTIMVLTAAFLFSMKKAYKPKIRLTAFSFFLGSNFVWIPMGFIVGLPWFLLTQGILVVLNIKGVIVCYREWQKNLIIDEYTEWTAEDALEFMNI